MNILITGAAGFVGKNLTAALECIRDGKDRTHPGLTIGHLYLYDVDSPNSLLEEACQKADFVFNLAGVNRPQNQEEFMQGNFGFASTLLNTLKKYHNSCPVMLSSSIQATLIGRYANGEYGKSKKAGEDLFFAYGEETGAKVLVYRSPTSSASGAVPTTILRWQPSAITMPTTCPLLSTILLFSWNCCTSMIWWMKWLQPWKGRNTAANLTVRIPS